MQLNEIYVQKHSDVDIYVMPTRELKKGGFYGLVYHAWHGGRAGGKAVKKSLANMYPAPLPIPEACIPEKILAKFK